MWLFLYIFFILSTLIPAVYWEGTSGYKYSERENWISVRIHCMMMFVPSLWGWIMHQYYIFTLSHKCHCFNLPCLFGFCQTAVCYRSNRSVCVHQSCFIDDPFETKTPKPTVGSVWLSAGFLTCEHVSRFDESGLFWFCVYGKWWVWLYSCVDYSAQGNLKDFSLCCLRPCHCFVCVCV